MKLFRKTFFLILGNCVNKFSLRVLAIVAMCVACAQTYKLHSAPKITPKVVKSFPHSNTSFTQGLIVIDDIFYESSGLYGKSSLRKVDKYTGKLINSINLDPNYFGEGLTIIGDNLYQLTWKAGVLFIYSKDTLEKKSELYYEGEGWGLTFNGIDLILSDGSNVLKVLNPKTLELVRTIDVFDEDKSVFNLNELEYIDTEIWANVWQSNKIACINPSTGRVTRWIDLSQIDESIGLDDVLNGIAWDKNNNKIYVTGKLWKRVYEISLDN
jgi:glutamine cyclotransferase